MKHPVEEASGQPPAKEPARFLSNPVLTVACLFLLAALTVCGTIYESRHGLYAARQLFFGSWFFLAWGVVPVPGVPAVSALLLANLLASMTAWRGGQRRPAGLWLVHAGLVILLVGGFASARWTRDATLTLAEGEASGVAVSSDEEARSVPLPVTIRLLDFQKEFYPASAIPKSFTSRLRVETPAGPREVAVSMNKPFRYGGFTFYQASYEDRADGREASTLAVSENRARFLPYVATVVIFAGLAIHFMRRVKREAPAVAEPRPPLAAIGAVAIAVAAAAALPSFAPYRGPVPLEPLSRVPILENGRVMPLDTFARNVLVSISGRTTAEGGPAIAWLARVLFAPDHASRDRVFLVSRPDTFEALGLSADPPRRRVSFVEIHPALMRLRDTSDPDMMRLAASIESYMHLFFGAAVAEAVAEATPERSVDEVIGLLASAGEAYRGDRAEEFRAATGKLASSSSRGRWEVQANRLDAFGRAKWLYVAAFILALAFARMRWAAWSVLLAGLILNTAGLILRAAIMGRPPVTNLYSTFAFVGWSCALLGAWAERRAQNRAGLLAGSVGGFLLLFVAGRYAFEGDAMGQVVAVLDSNLWLSAHVLSVMLGFAGCLMAAVVAHVHLLHTARGSADAAESTFGAMNGMLAFGLTFTFLGTMLGGVWADQAWGRFWGWDPKENGALVVILWCAILFHARAAEMIGRRGLAAGCILGGILVALAWVGVNLLGTGLHSYGWTSGAAAGLAALVAGEGLFLAGVMAPRRKKVVHTGPAAV